MARLKKVGKELEDSVESSKKYFVSDVADVDRVLDLDISRVRLIFKAGRKDRLEVSKEVAEEVKKQYPYLVIEEV